eukprot:1269399-Pyramimonas_sp.AAC.1
MLNTGLTVDRLYDLKGSTQGRLTPLDKPTKPTTVWKDLDLDMAFELGQVELTAKTLLSHLRLLSLENSILPLIVYGRHICPH